MKFDSDIKKKSYGEQFYDKESFLPVKFECLSKGETAWLIY